MLDVTGTEFLARLRSFVRRRVSSPSDADDVVQTVVVRLLASDARAVASPHAWVAAAARAAIVDLRRSRSRSAAGGHAVADALEVEDEQEEVSECLVPLLRELDPAERALLERVDVAGEKQSELARELGLSPSGLKSRVQRARARLRELVLARCQVERDASGAPVGPATCRPRRRGGANARERCCETSPSPFTRRPGC